MAHSQRLERLFTALIYAPAFIILATLSLGLRMALLKPNPAPDSLASDILVIAAVFSALTAVTGVIYVLFGFYRFKINWPLVLVSAEIGCLLFGFLNMTTNFPAMYNAKELVAATPTQAFVLGALDGVTLGLLIGVCICYIDPHPPTLTLAWIARYLVLYAAVVAVFALGQAINQVGSTGDRLNGLTMILLIIALRLIVGWWDKRQP